MNAPAVGRHTPGPWTIELSGGVRRPHNILGEGLTIAQTNFDTYHDEDRSDANARLIADAPDLLAVARECMYYWKADA